MFWIKKGRSAKYIINYRAECIFLNNQRPHVFIVVKFYQNLGIYPSVYACNRVFRDSGFISVNAVKEADMMSL